MLNIHIFSVNGKVLYKVRGYNDEVMQLSWCPQYEVHVNKAVQETLAMRLERIRKTDETAEDAEIITNEMKNVSIKANDESIQDNTANESEIVEEEDLFDMYKDHAADEFGHKKYVPEDIVVKVNKDDGQKTDYLSECQMLKDEILKRKNEPEPSIETLVDAFDKASVNEAKDDVKDEIDAEQDEKTQMGEFVDPKSVHIQRHLLASISKNG